MRSDILKSETTGLRRTGPFLLTLATVLTVFIGNAACESLPRYLRDRGVGTSLSIFGTYAKKGELLVYPFYELYRDGNAEYAPNEFGFDSDVDYRGKYRGSEGLVFLGYGVTEHFAVELEVATISARLETADADTITTPRVFEESGLGDVQTQFNWRFQSETVTRPELFGTLEIVYPLNKDKLLIGTPDWEYKLGAGVTRGFGFGTLTFRGSFVYERAERKVDISGTAIEYVRRFSDLLRVYAGFEAAFDEIEFISEAQLHLNRNVVVKLNNAFGVTSKATDWAPEFGVMFAIPTN